ncbi:MAG: serine/threonine protein kinase [Phycisphaerales bacterium]|nr:serine/threonine protein kinase [Phycisphaerales bacterium]
MTTPNRERRALLEDIFHHAADLSGQARSDYIQSRCAGDDALQREVEALLHELDTGTRGVLAAQAVPMPDIGPPKDIAGFQIERELGRGGMGVVYQAIQKTPRRTVALKVMRWDAMTPSGIKRFAREAEVLGQLKHPGIAQIYQAGMVNLDGRDQPYFAMEFVSGPDLKAHCDQRSLSREERLKLIVRLCEAVQYAHGRGFIHRDLKPGNILVEPPTLDTDRLGQPKVLDFGIARVTGSDEPSNTLRTHTGQIVGTLAYMSPEQAAGDNEKIDARCDVYALGAIAYELLTGRLPLTLSGRTVPEAMRIVIEQDPPSMRTVDRSLAGDLDAIVARALEKDIARRYQSAAELAADIDRFLRGEPVHARPASATYQLESLNNRATAARE